MTKIPGVGGRAMERMIFCTECLVYVLVATHTQLAQFCSKLRQESEIGAVRAPRWGQN